jgi:hypothetical protein
MRPSTPEETPLGPPASSYPLRSDHRCGVAEIEVLLRVQESRSTRDSGLHS